MCNKVPLKYPTNWQKKQYKFFDKIFFASVAICFSMMYIFVREFFLFKIVATDSQKFIIKN